MIHSLRSYIIVGLLGLLATAQSQAQTGPNPAMHSGGPAATPVIKPDSIFINPEVLPQFVGGNKAFADYLRKSIRYPQVAMQRHISGKVYVNFILSAQGKVQDVHVVSGPGSGLNDEAMRLIWMMPPWEPGRSNGRPVRVACTIPITFSAGH